MAEYIKIKTKKRMTLVVEPGSEVIVTKEQYKLIDAFADPVIDANVKPAAPAPAPVKKAPKKTKK